MKRREFIALLGASAAWPIAGYAQQPGKIFRIGFLGFGSAATWANRGLRDLGYVDGKNIVIEFRSTEAVKPLPELATELVRMNVDVIFAASSTEVAGPRCAAHAARPCR
jgi:putative ABC transport system substrate-binding protein